MAMRIPGPKKPESGTLLGNAASVSPEWYNIPKTTGPNWNKWSNMPTVELWEAVALSLDIEPNLIVQKTGPDFDSRMEIAVANLRTCGALEPVERNPILHRSRVLLGDVARLAASCAWDLPAEFPKPHASTVKMQPAESSVTPENAEPAPTGNEESVIRRKRSALIDELKSIWPTVELDLRDSSRGNRPLNGAKLPEYGYWDLTKAVTWAAERGKITKQKAAQHVASNQDSVFSATLMQLFNL